MSFMILLLLGACEPTAKRVNRYIVNNYRWLSNSISTGLLCHIDSSVMVVQ